MEGYRTVAGEIFDTDGNFFADSAFNFASSNIVARRRTRKKVKRSSHKARRGATRKHKRTRHIKRSRGGIRYTKKGQPYRIMPNGRARFIKKR